MPRTSLMRLPVALHGRLSGAWTSAPAAHWPAERYGRLPPAHTLHHTADGPGPAGPLPLIAGMMAAPQAVPIAAVPVGVEPVLIGLPPIVKEGPVLYGLGLAANLTSKTPSNRGVTRNLSTCRGPSTRSVQCVCDCETYIICATRLRLLFTLYCGASVVVQWDMVRKILQMADHPAFMKNIWRPFFNKF